MAYVTGVANSFAELLTALQNACTANGWTLSGDVLHKGTCYASVVVGGLENDSGAPATGGLRVRAGNGIDGSNVLQDAASGNGYCGILQSATNTTWPDWDWPVTYHVHVLTAPDEVFLLMNYGAGQFWQWLAFGQSPAPGNAGTGNWHSAVAGFAGADARKVNKAGYWPAGGAVERGTDFGWGPFWWGEFGNYTFAAHLGSRIHGCIDPSSGLPVWSHTQEIYGKPGAAVTTEVTAGYTAYPLLTYSPNAWNNETHLIPIQIWQQRPSNKGSLIGELQHIRMCRNDFIEPGAVITIGSDQWKVYPCYRRNTAARDGAERAGIDHSGTIAMAIRYDGP